MSFPELEEAQKKRKKQVATANYPELEQARAKAIEQKEAKYEKRKKTAPTQHTVYLQRVSSYARQQVRSARFYREIGFPEFAGKYAPFEIPEGYKVEKLKKTAEGLQVSLTPTKEQPKGVAETIMGWDLPSLNLREKMLPFSLQATFPRPHPLGLVAGSIASVESFAYGIGRLAGLPTPRPPPTFTGGMIWSGVESVASGKPVESVELRETMKYGSEYAAGSILGDVFLSIAIGKGVSKLAQPITKPIMAKAETWLSKQYLEKGPLAWKGWTEKLVMKATGAKPWLAPEIISVPSHSVMQIPQVSSAVWQYSLTPKTSLLFIEKFASEQTKFLPKYFIRGTAMVPMATSMVEAAYKPMPEDYLLSAPKQIGITVKKTVRRMLPYIPKTSYFTESTTNFLSHIISFGLVGATRTGKKVKYEPEIPTLTLPKLSLSPEAKQEKKTKLALFAFPSLAPKMGMYEKLFPSVSLEPTQKAAQNAIQSAKQLTRQIMKMGTPTLTTSTFPKFPFEERRKRRYKGKRKKRKKTRVGRYKRYYPVATPKELMEMYA